MTTRGPQGRFIAALAGCAVALLAGCAAAPSRDDPLEPMNRAMYRVNEVVDGHFVKPAVQAYVDYTPRLVQRAISNFFGNIDDVFSVINDFLQWKLDKASNDMGRVMLNTGPGLGGLIDIASDAGIEKGNEDFGQTLGYWGFPQGPYLFIPLFGPSTIRDGSGSVLRAYLGPIGYLPNVATRNVIYGINAVDMRASALQSESLIDKAALDPYTFIRRSYLQRREYLVNDGRRQPPKDDQ